jgi:hypothetical protein
LSLGAPFPTLYWFVHPQISRAIADLERRGFVNKIEETVRSDAQQTQDLWQCHKQYAAERWATLSLDHRNILLNTGDVSSLQRMTHMLRDSGIAGTNITALPEEDSIPSVKCLHAHYADFRSSLAAGFEHLNPVGVVVHQSLQDEFPSLLL